MAPGTSSRPLSSNLVELIVEPPFNVAPPEAHVSTDAKAGWTFVSVSPRVDGRYGHSEVVGEFLDSEKPIETFHPLSMKSNPLTRVPFRCTWTCHCVGDADLAGDFGG